jgi:hypothetical protein
MENGKLSSQEKYHIQIKPSPKFVLENTSWENVFMSKTLSGCDVTFHEPIKTWVLHDGSVDIHTIDTTITIQLPRKMNKKEVSDFLESKNSETNIWKERFEKLAHSPHVETETKWYYNIDDNLDSDEYQNKLIAILDQI